MSRLDCFMICYLIVFLLSSTLVNSSNSPSSMINCLSEDELLLLIGFNPEVLSSINNSSNCNYSIPSTQNKNKSSNTKQDFYEFEVLNHNYSLDIGIYENDLVHLQHFDDLYVEKLNIVKKSYYEVNDVNINYSNDILNYLGNKHLLLNAMSNAKLSYTETVNY